MHCSARAQFMLVVANICGVLAPIRNSSISDPNGCRRRGNVYVLKNFGQIFRDGNQDIFKDLESNLGPVTGF